MRRFLAIQIGLTGVLLSAVPFEPEIDFSITEAWRWHELEQLSDYSIFKGIETADEKLVFTGKDNVLIYDGYTIEKIPYPIQDEGFLPFDLFMADENHLIITSSAGVFGYRDEQWTQLTNLPIRNAEIRNLIANNRKGLQFVALPDGLYQIVNGELESLPNFDRHYSSISFDKRNRLWFTEPGVNELGYLQFDENNQFVPSKTKVFDLNYGDTVFPWVIASPDSEEVWTANWRADLVPMRFDNVNDTWISVDLSHLSGNNSHSSGYRINETDMVIFSKSATLIYHREQWHSIGKPEFDYPTNIPFYILRKNGRLVLGGRGEKIYEVDYKPDQHDSLHGLHFQCDSPDGSQWFISLGDKIVQHQLATDEWISHEKMVIDTPLVIIRSHDGMIWVAGAHEGVAAVSRYNGINWQRDKFPSLNGFIGAMSARKLPDGRVFFGSGEDLIGQQPGGGVIYERTTSDYTPQVIAPPFVPSRPVGIGVDKQNKIWFGGFNLATTDMSFESPLQVSKKFSRVLWVDDVSEDDEGRIWVAQWERGLFTYTDGEWVTRKISTEIADSQVSMILKDEHRPGNLWFATNSGVSRFDGQRWYPQALPNTLRFNRESGTLRQSSDGAIWINFATRSWYFRRDTGFFLTKRLKEVFKTVRFQPDENPPIVNITSEITRSTAPSNLHVSWEGVDKWSHTPQSELKYSFRLNSEPWSSFTRGFGHILLDLPTGKHRFEVRALDLDGNLSSAAVIPEFIVVPPLWQRTWFITLAALTVVTIITLTLLLIRQRIRHIVKLEEFKLQFFTNISHELRTPLTVILGPLESQLSKLPPGWNKRPLEIAYKNAQRTLTLIDQILDFRRAETGKIKVNLARADLSAAIHEVFELIRPLADERSQTITLIRETDNCHVWYDAEIIEKILNNLISNSVKYTQHGGAITVRFRTTSSVETVSAELIVEDNGSGIPSGKIDNIFQVFYRAGNAKSHKVRGSGIGLAYTKNLVEACDGTITAESPIAKVNGNNQGTRFTVTIPMRMVTEKEEPPPAKPAAPVLLDPPTEDSAHDAPVPDSSTDDRPVLLLVEDDGEIRRFLAEELDEHYRVLVAVDGAEALTIAHQQIPDLVLTDVMMPELDGKELCRRLKTDEATSHIPIVMLTALKSEMHELEGLEIGADDYLSKPIKLVILKRRIHNLLESRRTLQARFQQQKEAAKLVASEVTSNRVDAAFMEKALQVVEDHLEDPLFDVENFSEQLFMSRMTLYRKFKAITGDTPGAFIRSIRMNKAAGILATGEHNVSETAGLVGFTDLSSFSTAFKTYFDVPPSKYTKRH